MLLFQMNMQVVAHLIWCRCSVSVRAVQQAEEFEDLNEENCVENGEGYMHGVF